MRHLGRAAAPPTENFLFKKGRRTMQRGTRNPSPKTLRWHCPTDVDGAAINTRFSPTRTLSLPLHTDVISAVPHVTHSSVRSSGRRPLPLFVSSDSSVIDATAQNGGPVVGFMKEGLIPRDRI
ncbi:hypothetical protein PIB30_017400 [Stylosanthes scabra]|uniref:Uncharacterized protein n=1 Tax=Stylosanthes scabra TaxID=79078 RepID=A0ABU6V5V2_9FABA|nr:hypothetical protein [Stylosanthes scabra]